MGFYSGTSFFHKTVTRGGEMMWQWLETASLRSQAQEGEFEVTIYDGDSALQYSNLCTDLLVAANWFA